MSRKVAILLSEETANDIEKALQGMAAQARLLAGVLEGARRRIGVAQAPATAPPQEPPTPPSGPAT